MAKNKGAEKNLYVPDEHEKKVMRFMKRLTAIPYLLVFLALIMPLATVSCTGANLVPPPKAHSADSAAVQTVPQVEMKETVLLEANLYQFIGGINLEKQLTEKGLLQLKKIEGGPMGAALKANSPEYPKMPGIAAFGAILLGVLLSALFAQFTAVGSIAMGMLTWVSLWGALSMIGKNIENLLGAPIIKVEPGVGVYAATFMIFFGVAMNFASIIRPIVMELKARRKAKSSR